MDAHDRFQDHFRRLGLVNHPSCAREDRLLGQSFLAQSGENQDGLVAVTWTSPPRPLVERKIFDYGCPGRQSRGL